MSDMNILPAFPTEEEEKLKMQWEKVKRGDQFHSFTAVEDNDI